MNFSIATIIGQLIAPRHELSCSWWVWRRLLRGLRERGLGRTRESGAFLLGHRKNGRARIVDFVLYDDLDPHCLDTGIVRFNGQYFGELWEICKRKNLIVVADIHVHPGGAGQSDSDKKYPMISRAGHVAMILANFATVPVRRREIGIYRYKGSKLWDTIPAKACRGFFHIGI